MAKIVGRDDNHAKCDKCGHYKEYVDSGIITNSGKLIFIGANGKPWIKVGKSKTCSDCNGSGTIPKELLKWDGKPRICKECNHRVLPVRRHRVCEFCDSSLSKTEVDEDFGYLDMGE